MRRWMISLCALMSLAAITVSQAQNSAEPQEKPVYEVYAISYGVIPDFPVHYPLPFCSG